MEILRPFRADNFAKQIPRALPWASLLRADGATERKARPPRGVGATERRAKAMLHGAGATERNGNKKGTEPRLNNHPDRRSAINANCE
jgi:hypothetical protein